MKNINKIKYLIIPIIILFVLSSILIYNILNFSVSSNTNLNYITFRLPKETPVQITFLGNSPLSDDLGTQENFVSMLESNSTINAINLSMPNTYATSQNATFRPEYALDAFSLYWVAAAIGTNNYDNYTTAFEYLNPISNRMRDVLNQMQNLDTSETTFFALWYDASDYIAGRTLSNPENSTDIQTYCGVLNATIQLLKALYPDIQIIVFSPPYAYSPNSQGEYENSDKFHYNKGYLYEYVKDSYDVCRENSVTFIDTYALTNNKQNMFKDYIHLNQLGKETILNHFLSIIQEHVN